MTELKTEAPADESLARTWFLSQLGTQTSDTTSVNTVGLHEEIPFDKVYFAIASLASKYEELRTQLFVKDNRPVLVQDDADAQSDLNVVDIATLPQGAEFSETLWTNVHVPGEPLTRWTVAVTHGRTDIGLSASRIVCDDRKCAQIMIDLLRELHIDAEVAPEFETPDAPHSPWGLREIIDQLSHSEPLATPSNISRPPVKGGHVESVRVGDSDTFATHLDVLIGGTKSSRVDISAALLATVVARHSGIEALAIGIPSLNRRKQVELLPVPIQLNDAAPVDMADHISQCRRIYSDEPTSMADIINRTRVGRDPSRTPIFQAAVTDSSPLIRITKKESGSNTRHFHSPYDITLVGPLAENSRGEWHIQFDPQILDADTAHKIAAHLDVAARSAASNPSKPLTDLPILTDSETSELYQWSDGGAAASQGELLHARTLQQLKDGGQGTALVDSDGTVSFDQLSTLVSSIGEAITAHAPADESLVAVIAGRNRFQIAATIATNVYGAAYLPIDPALPDERLAFLLNRGRTTLVLADSAAKTGHEWPEKVQVLDIQAHLSSAPSPSRSLPKPVDVSPQRTAYVIFTSGSTGQPKGVEIAHESATNTVVDICRRFQITSEDSVLALSALNFDLSVFDLYGILGAGGTAILLDGTEARDPQRWAEHVAKHKITIWNSVPALVELMISAAENRDIDLSSLRLVMMSGDWIPVTLPDRIRVKCPNATIISMGGATEASIWSILYRIGEVDPSWDSIPYGTPLAGQSFRILDSARNPVPQGVAGELYIGGIGVAKGYWRDDDKTESSFVELSDGTRWYKTGDFGKYRADGNIKFLGRKDSQVKVNGYRIELTEIDHNLREHAMVSDAHCVVRHEDDNARIVAYVVAPHADLQIADIRDFLRRRLPTYMVPSRYVFLESFPLTTNGKIDAKSLPAPGAQDDGRVDNEVASGGNEDAIHRVWCRVLQRTHVGRDEDFFAAGGDSIAALDVVSSLRAGGLAIRPQDLFDHPTILGLAEVAVPIAPESRERLQIRAGDVIPLTPVQKWFISLGFSRPNHFNRTAWLRADEPIDVHLLNNALKKLIAKHDALRLTFTNVDGQWRQRIVDVEDDQITSAITELGSDQDSDDMIKKIQSSFDLAVAPLIRLVVVNSSTSPRVMVTVHHLISDGISVNVLCDDLDRFYTDPTVEEDTTGSGFADWAHEADQYAAFANPEGELEYWREVGSNSESQHITGQTPTRSAELSLCSARFCNDRLTADRLLECANKQRVSVRDIVLAACVLALHQWRNIESIQIDIEGHGRHDVRGKLDISRTVGWFNVIYPVTVQLRRGSALGALRRTRRALDQVPRQGLGYGQLRFKTEHGHDLTTDSDVAFNFLGREVETGRILKRDPSLAARFERSELDPLPHKMAITPRIVEDRLDVEFTSRESYTCQKDLDCLVEIFNAALSGLLEECDRAQQDTAGSHVFHAFTGR